MSPRFVEAALIVLIMLAIAGGGASWLADVAAFHGFTIAVLAAVAVVIVAAFRRQFVGGAPRARIYATRDTAFLAAIAGAIAFVASPARWSAGATVAALEFALAIELLARVMPATP